MGEAHSDASSVADVPSGESEWVTIRLGGLERRVKKPVRAGSVDELTRFLATLPIGNVWSIDVLVASEDARVQFLADSDSESACDGDGSWVLDSHHSSHPRILALARRLGVEIAVAKEFAPSLRRSRLTCSSQIASLGLDRHTPPVNCSINAGRRER